MIIKLTNNATPRKGQTILINFDHVLSIYPDEIDGDKVTILYSTTSESWVVAETVENIYDKLAA